MVARWLGQSRSSADPDRKRDGVEKQRVLLAGDQWIVDSNEVDNDILVERADTLWFSRHLGGSARGVRSSADYGDLAMLSCPTVAMNRSCSGYEMSGELFGVTGGIGKRCPNVTLLLLRTAKGLSGFTF